MRNRAGDLECCCASDLRETRGYPRDLISEKISSGWRGKGRQWNEGREAARGLETRRLVARVDLGKANSSLPQTQSNLVNVIAAAVSEIARWDFPDKWSNLVGSLCAHIEGGDPRPMWNALKALRLVVKRYEYKPLEMRGPLISIIQAAFPLLKTVYANLLPLDSVEAASIRHLILKVRAPACIPPSSRCQEL
eukprot:scaffold1130_cov195-Pinguiococcus_pyrenoidosus.AAC.41